MNYLEESQNRISEKMPHKNTYRTNNINTKIFKHANISKIYIKEICPHVIGVKKICMRKINEKMCNKCFLKKLNRTCNGRVCVLSIQKATSLL